MKASLGQIERALDTVAADVRLFLLHGPDESGSRALADRLANAMGEAAERIDLTGAALKADPALLADEAAALSLFGGRRYIRVIPAGDETLEAVEALLAAPAAGNPVVLVAGALRKDAKLLKRVTADRAALAFASYSPEGQVADQLAIRLGHALGLRIRPDIGRRLVEIGGGDRAVLAQELEKLALYLDAAPERPADLEHDAIDAIAAGSGEGDLSRLVDLVLGGESEAADAERARLAGEGIEGIALLRPLLRRLLLLAQLRAALDDGDSIDQALTSAGPSLFWKSRPIVTRQLGQWDGRALATAIERIGAAERAIKASGGIGPLAAEAELLAIGRAAARRR
jgi:DNA polymerase-3 subunit delta